jgi:outer membrane protein TolC
VRPFLVPLLAAAAFATSAQPARAEAVTFEQALGGAARAPTVVGAAEAEAVREAMDRGITGAPENPQIQVMPGYRFTPQGEEGLELQVTIQQGLSLDGLGDARQRAARTEREVLAMEHAASLLERRLGVAQAWLDVWASAEELRLVREERETAGRLLSALERAAAAGERTRIDLATMRGYAAEVDLRTIAIEGRLHHEGLWLGSEMGRTDGEPVLVRGDAPSVRLPEALRIRRLIVHAERMPGVARHRLVALSARAREVEARAEAASRLYVGASAQLNQPDNGFVLFGLVGAQLSMFTQNERARSTQLGDAEQIEGERGQAERDARRAAADAIHELDHTRETEAALRERLVPALEEVAALEERALGLGESTVLRLVEARRRVLEAHERLAEATGERIWAEVNVWLMLEALERSGGMRGGGR